MRNEASSFPTIKAIEYQGEKETIVKPPKQYNGGGIPNLVCWGNSDLAAADKHKTILYPRLYFAPYRTDECLIISRLKKPSVGENGSHCHTKKHHKWNEGF